MDFLKYLENALGSIYVWGAQGESNISESWIRKMETSTVNANRAIATWKRQKAAGVKNIRAFDCSGLVVRYMLDEKLRTNDTTAAGLYNESKKLNATDLKGGDLVFTHNGSKISHVGVYIGNDYVIHARGRDYGVVKETLRQNGPDFWNRYGRIERLSAKFDTSTNTGGNDAMAVILKKTSPLTKADYVKTLQEALNAMGYNAGTADGVCGDNTLKAIQEFSKNHYSGTSVSSSPKSYTLTVTGDDGSNYSAKIDFTKK